MDQPQPQNQVGQRESEVAHKRYHVLSLYDRGQQKVQVVREVRQMTLDHLERVCLYKEC